MNKHYIAGLFALALVVWLASGSIKSESAAVITEADRTDFSVTVIRTRSEPYRLTTMVRGRVDADREVMVGSKTQGEVVSTPFREGQFVKTGDVLCEIELGDRDVLVDQARAALAEAELNYQGVTQLAIADFQSELSVARAESELNAARVALRQAELNLEYAKIRAPFDGVLEEQIAEQGSYIKSGAACARLLDVDPYIFVGLVSEYEVENLHEDQPAILIQSGQPVAEAKLRFVSHQAEAMTRSYKIEAELLHTGLRAGQTASLAIELGEIQAHFIPQSALKLSEEGGLSVKIVDDQSLVQSQIVEVIGETTEGVWVTGIPEMAQVIVMGADYTVPGDRVRVVVGDSK